MIYKTRFRMSSFNVLNDLVRCGTRSTSSNSHSQKTQGYRLEDLGCQVCGWDRQRTKFYQKVRSLNCCTCAEMFYETPSFTIVTVHNAYPACDSEEQMTFSEAVIPEEFCPTVCNSNCSL
ncbi:hypothetical protein AVEN_232738-1 [Araneus ventricosus]|uniref:Uncharacterized protein n=1 Tax=Araneus ventricosus TaxID=182803 RepID=A0A4Y2HGV5_ARAVE|nr:hypothetical protein AVEN_232738-1 [Araneus ventricosus]